MISCRFCPKNWIYRPNSNSCYLVTTSVRRPWAEAQLACEANDAYLLKLDDKEERLWIIKELAKIQGSDPLRSSEWWLGLNDIKQTMKWVWTDGTPVDNTAIVWNDYEPNNWGGSEWCAELWGHGLNDKSCSTVQAYICERSKDLPFHCDNDRGWESYNGTCYKYFPQELDWFNAKLSCEEEGSQMVTVLNRNTEFYVNDATLLNKKPIWLGLRYVETADSSAEGSDNYHWEWIDGTKLALHFWNEGRFPIINETVKNDSCTYVDPFIKNVNIWSPGRCYEVKSFICQKKPGNCQDGWELHQESCFQFNSMYRLSQPEAEKYCRHQGGHLADLDSSYDQIFINSKLNELKKLGVMVLWLGITVDTNGNYIWDSGEELTYTNWRRGTEELVDAGEQKRCVIINTEDADGKWQPVSNCDQKESFVCEIPVGSKITKVTPPELYFRCAEGWSSFNNYCYFFNNTRSTWIGAKSACHQQQSNLVKVDDENTQFFINSMSQKNQWIGLNDRSQEGVMVWESDGTKLGRDDYTNWMEEEPNNQEGHENCVVIFKRKPVGKWADFDCNRKFSFICQRLAENAPRSAPPATIQPKAYDPRCGAEWEVGPTGAFCYHFSDEQLSWFDARVTCYHHGGELASITEKSEQYFIAGRIRIFQSMALWLGANDLTRESEWHWNDYSPMSFFNWGTGQPDNIDRKENCALIAKATSFWYDSDCRSRNGYICKKKATQLEPTTVQTPTTVSPDYYYHCDEGWKAFNSKCYKVVDELYTWHGARKNCRQNGGDLVSIDNAAEQSFTKSILDGSEGQWLYWIGLNELNHKGTYTWSHGNKVQFTDWSLGEPNHLLGQSCVTMLFIDGKWRDYECDKQAKSICRKDMEKSKRTEDIGCLAGYILFAGKCYQHVYMMKSHEEAQTYCRQVLDAQLPVVDSPLIENFLTSHADKTRRQVRYWISSGYWNKDSPGRLREWCQAFTSLAQWDMLPCNIKAYFVCSRPLSKLPTDATEPSTGIPITTTISTSQQPVVTETLPLTTTTAPLIPCPNGWKYFNGYCYKEFSKYLYGLTWEKASESCDYAGSELVSVHSEEEMRFLQANVMKPNSKYSYWTGARISRHGLVGWTDGTKVDFSPRIYGDIPASESNPCAVIQHATQTLILRKCELFADWICKFKKHVTDDSVPQPKSARCSIASGLDEWSHFNGSCFLSPLDFKKFNWHKSRTMCEIFGSTLASIHSMQENAYVDNTFHTYMWIGIHSHISKPYNTWIDTSTIGFTNWDEGEPKNPYEYPCVAIVPSTGKWRTFSCYKKFAALCQRYDGDATISAHPVRSEMGGCPKGFIPFDTKCYLIGGTNKGEQLSWRQAEGKCRTYGEFFGLASISNSLQQAFLTQMLYKFSTSLWIGMRVKDATLTWEDNSELSFVHLPSSQIEKLFRLKYEYCIAMHTEKTAAGMWFPAFCEEKAGYICQGYKNTSIPEVAVDEEVKDDARPGYVKYRESYYKVVTELKTWQEAEAFCQSEGGHLVSVLNVYENAFLYLLNKDVEEFWIGAKLTKRQFSWSDNSSMLYTDWVPIEVIENQTSCGVISNVEKWNLVECEKQHQSVCKISTGTTNKNVPIVLHVNGICPTGWLGLDDNCYLIVKDRTRSWPEANFECTQIGAKLASFHSIADVAFSQQHAKLSNSYFEGFWIGLSMKDGTLSWVDGSPVNFENFMHGNTANEGHASYVTGVVSQDSDRNCVLIHTRTGLWRRASCYYRLGYICMAPKHESNSTDGMVTPEVCIDCPKRTPVQEKPTGLTTAEVVGIILVVPTVMIVSAIIAYFVIKRKSVRMSTDGQGFVNSLYEAPNFMSLKEEMEKNPS